MGPRVREDKVPSPPLPSPPTSFSFPRRIGTAGPCSGAPPSLPDPWPYSTVSTALQVAGDMFPWADHPSKSTHGKAGYLFSFPTYSYMHRRYSCF